METINLSKAAKMIGISRPTLYHYLKMPQYKPTEYGGRPTLTKVQVEMIKLERRHKAKSRNGRK